MIQPDANADSPNEVSASALATDEPLSSLPTDDVGELIEELRDRPRFVAEGPRYLLQLNERAASTLSRLRGERDELQGWYEKVCLVASTHLTARLKAEDINRKLVEGLEKIAGFVRQRPGGDKGSYQRGYDIGFNNAGVTAAEFARRALLSSISGEEAAGEDGP